MGNSLRRQQYDHCHLPKYVHRFCKRDCLYKMQRAKNPIPVLNLLTSFHKIAINMIRTPRINSGKKSDNRQRELSAALFHFNVHLQKWRNFKTSKKIVAIRLKEKIFQGERRRFIQLPFQHVMRKDRNFGTEIKPF